MRVFVNENKPISDAEFYLRSGKLITLRFFDDEGIGFSGDMGAYILKACGAVKEIHIPLENVDYIVITKRGLKPPGPGEMFSVQNIM